MSCPPARRWQFDATAPAPQLHIRPGTRLTVENGWARLDVPGSPVLAPTTRLLDLAPAHLRAVGRRPLTRRLAS